MAALWIELRDEEPKVWHRAVARIGPGRHRLACGWESGIADARRYWPAKVDEPGPSAEEQCRACVGAASADG